MTVLLLGLAGCSSSSANLVGHWRGIRAEGVSPDAAETSGSFATHMRIDVKGNVLTVTTAKDTRTDRYSVVEEDKAKTIITTESDGASNPQTFFFPDAKTMKWAAASGGAVVFVKE